ncbi:hypothetical protein BLNAU_10407 [Blattamonas nauphoetae]|uniref:Uncharacterized protein n=1 Tax=Blattamonas nauphoetae TaxID=2049346 RepID=A0ABQ9XQY4_9EUKA|nr:hypothetical protein BLNAU_10407 [Blattamonas nauphoetae]
MTSSKATLTQIEVNHAVRFLEYAIIHIKHYNHPYIKLTETIFPQEANCQTKVTSALINLICHPTNKLHTVAFSFFDAFTRHSSDKCTIAVTVTEDIIDPYGIGPSSSRALAVTPEITNPIIQQFCPYLRYLLATSVSSTDYPSGLSILRNMIYFGNHLIHTTPSSSPAIKQFIDDLKKTMTEELASSLNLTTTIEVISRLLFDELDGMDEHRWAETFERILVRLSEGRPLSDVGLEAIRWDGWFCSSKTLPLKALFSIFVPTQTHHTTALLAAFRRFTIRLDKGVLVERVWKGWFSAFFDAVNPSTLPFTNEFESLHTQLVEVLNDRLVNIWACAHDCHSCCSRKKMNKIHRSFYEQTSEYIVHLSLHPFALATQYSDSIILDFLIRLFQNDDDDPVAKSLLDELRQQMDEAARSSSSPPFILTSELVCRLTDEEILNVVDRIVGLLESDSSFDDDTILRICTFLKKKFESVYLPELFRKAGRTIAQYFHAFESLLSLHVDSFNLHPINSLLCPKPIDLQPTFDEWDDVDFATVGVVVRAVRENILSFKRHSSQFTLRLLDYVEPALHQVHLSATRLRQSQLEQLITPSIDILNTSFFEHIITHFGGRKNRDEVFIDVCRLCDQHAIARCLSSVGFFSRIVGGVLDYCFFNQQKYGLNVFIDQASDFGNERAERTKLRRAIPLILEEGWQDAVEFVFIKKKANFIPYSEIETTLLYSLLSLRVNLSYSLAFSITSYLTNTNPSFTDPSSNSGPGETQLRRRKHNSTVASTAFYVVRMISAMHLLSPVDFLNPLRFISN